MKTHPSTVLAALLLGVLVGGAAVQVATPPDTGTSVPSHGLSTATGCADADDPRGWVGTVPTPDHRAVYLMNYSYRHRDATVDLRSDLTQPEPGRWVLAIRTEPDPSDKTLPAECRPRTTIDASVALPTTAASLGITIDGETVAVIDTTAPEPRFFYLLGEASR
ncbi:MAG: hypothetical protein ABEK02_08730 [Haloquadratum sp.]